MMKKKKIAVLSGMIGIMTSSLILAACGSSFDLNNVKEIKFELPFRKKDSQAQAMEAVVAKYNSFAESTENKAQGYLPVNVFANALGYGDTSTGIINNLQVGNYRDLPNLTLNYGSLVMDLARHQSNLDFGVSSLNSSEPKTVTYTDGTEKKTINLKDDVTNKANFNPALLNINDNIQGVKSGGLYLVPAGVSTEVIYLNKPVMHYVMDQMIKKNYAKIKSDDVTWFEQNFGVKNNDSSSSSTPVAKTTNATSNWTATDQEAVKKIWGELGQKTSSDTSSFELKKTMFDHYYDLLSFATKVASLFTTKKGGVAAFDSLANTVEIMAFNKLKYDYKKFLWHKSGDGSYTYPYLKNAESEQAKAFQEAYGKLESLSKANHGLWLRPNKNTFASADFTDHKLLFNLGSNAGYDHRVNMGKKVADNTVLNDESELLVLPQPSSNEASTNTSETLKGSYTSQGGSLIGISFKNRRLDRATKLFVQWLTSDASKVFSLKQASSETTQMFNGADYYALKGSYVATSASFLDDANSANYMPNPASKTAFEQFKARKNQSQYVAYYEPVSTGSSPFRNLIESLNSQKTELTSYNDMLDKLKANPILIGFTR